MSLQTAPRLVNLTQKQQPFVLAYLLGVGGDTLNRDERELLLYIGIVVWQIMSQGDLPLKKITSEVLEETEEENMKMLEYLEDEPEASFIDIVEKIINDYPQPEVLIYVVEALMEEPEEGVLIRDENIGIMTIYLKTIIDCFDK
ncbi:MAG: hypothetical protein NC820_06580 [Candidatus Omnitrophica bacterium]|nr:hypothetical protein [Candidatus Omnitrophota bacterium]